jgi:hypothetical protein
VKLLVSIAIALTLAGCISDPEAGIIVPPGGGCPNDAPDFCGPHDDQGGSGGTGSGTGGGGIPSGTTGGPWPTQPDGTCTGGLRRCPRTLNPRCCLPTGTHCGVDQDGMTCVIEESGHCHGDNPPCRPLNS